MIEKKLRFLLIQNKIEYKRRELGDFSELNKKWSVSNSKTIKERLKKINQNGIIITHFTERKGKVGVKYPILKFQKKLKDRE